MLTLLPAICASCDVLIMCLSFLSFTTPPPIPFFFFFLNDPAPPEIYPLSLHDALPILLQDHRSPRQAATPCSVTDPSGCRARSPAPGTAKPPRRAAS